MEDQKATLVKQHSAMEGGLEEMRAIYSELEVRLLGRDETFNFVWVDNATVNKMNYLFEYVEPLYTFLAKRGNTAIVCTVNVQVYACDKLIWFVNIWPLNKFLFVFCQSSIFN